VSSSPDQNFEHETELIVVNLGTPYAPTEDGVRTFLAEFLSDPMVVDRPPRWIWKLILHGIVLRKRPAPVAEMYRTIWTPSGSPLATETEALAALVRGLAPPQVRVTHAYRYGTPNVREAVEQAAQRSRGIVVVPLFPQPTASSSGTVDRLVEETAERLDLGPRVRLARIAPEDPGYIRALAERYEHASNRAGGEAPDHLLMSFHGIPTRVNVAEQEVYSKACRATAEALRKELGLPAERVTLAFQSRFGREPWLTPATDETLAQLPTRGVKSLAVIAPGFLTDGLETLEELGVRGRESFLEAGGEDFLLIPAPAAHRALAETLIALA